MVKNLMKQVIIQSKFEEKCMKILQKINKRNKNKDFHRNLKLKSSQLCLINRAK
jgi:hypothetical protein